jgi:hypothetical protein
VSKLKTLFLCCFLNGSQGNECASNSTAGIALQKSDSLQKNGESKKRKKIIYYVCAAIVAIVVVAIIISRSRSKKYNGSKEIQAMGTMNGRGPAVDEQEKCDEQSATADCETKMQRKHNIDQSVTGQRLYNELAGHMNVRGKVIGDDRNVIGEYLLKHDYVYDSSIEQWSRRMPIQSHS